MSEITVVIPTRNRHDILQRALSCLDDGAEAPDHVIIVDDASTVPVQSCITTTGYRFDLTVLRQNERHGAPAARNRGIASAKTPLLLMMDDDVWADHEMIRRHRILHDVHSSQGYGVLGRVVFDADMTRTPLLHYLEEYGAYRWLAGLREGELYRTGIVTANVSVKRNFLLGKDLFDEDFPYNRNEDSEFGLRLMNHGFEPRFHSGPSARHHAPLSMEDCFRHMVQGGHSKAYWSNKTPDDTDFCIHLKEYVGKHMHEADFAGLKEAFVNALPTKFLGSDVLSCSEAQFDEFRKFMQISEGWLTALGIIAGWEQTTPRFDEMLPDIVRGMLCADPRERIRRYRNAHERNPDWLPMALLLSDSLRATGEPGEAVKILAPFGGSIWAQIGMGQAEYHLGRMHESVSRFVSVVANTDRRKAIAAKQRRIATKWLLKLLHKGGEEFEWAQRLWCHISEEDEEQIPEWVHGLEAHGTLHGYITPRDSFSQRFPQLTALASAREKLERLGAEQGGAGEPADQYVCVWINRNSKLCRIAEAMDRLTRRSLGKTVRAFAKKLVG